MPSFQELIRQLRERSLWQILGSYVVAAWVVLQVLDTVSALVGLPLWFTRPVLVLLIIGFFVLLLTGLVQRTWTTRRARAESGPARTRLARLLTWRRAVLAGAGAFTLLGIFTAAWLAMRALGIGPVGSLIARGVLDERAVVLLADFESTDSLLARAATEAFRVDLSQSSSIQLAEPAAVAEGLTRMEREPGGELPADVALQLAEREGMPAVVAGQIHPAGSGYVLSASLVAPGSGAILASRRETAADAGAVIRAIDRLSKGLRERIGESLRSIQGDPPLSRVTTSNLEALKKYSEASRAARAGDLARAVELLEEAVAIDTSFASAWRALAVYLTNLGERRSRAVRALQKAYDHRDRLTERERWTAVGSYHLEVTFEPEKAVQAYLSLLETDPHDFTALNNVAAVYSELRDPERSAEYLARARAADTTNLFGYTNMADVRVRQGRFAEAAAELAAAEARLGGSGMLRWYQAQLAANRNDFAEAERRHRETREQYVGNLLIRAILDSDLASMLATQGRLREAEAHALEALAANEARDARAAALDDALQLAWVDLLLLGDRDRAVERVESALGSHPLADLDPLDRPYAELAAFYARAGDHARASSLLNELESAVPAEIRGKTELDRLRARAEIALAQGRYADALADFRASDRGDCVLCALPGLSATYEAAGERDSALAVYERFIETTWIDRYWGDDFHFAFLLGPANERLALLYDEGGDLERAAVYYARLVELWKNADPELEPRVSAARNRLQRILAERG